LEEEFSRFGKIVDVYIPYERGSGKASEGRRGFGFVTFEDPRDAEDAADEMDDREFDGRVIRVNKARPREPLPGQQSQSSSSSSSSSRYRARKGPTSSEVCRDFSRGRCSRGDTCRFQHDGDDRDKDRDSDDRDRDRD